MNLLQTIIPVPIPIDGSSGLWTESDTKIALTILILTFICFLLAIVIEKIRGVSLKDILQVNTSTLLSEAIILCSYSVFGIAILSFFGYFIYTLL
jgi:hypothetical protein